MGTLDLLKAYVVPCLFAGILEDVLEVIVHKG